MQSTTHNHRSADSGRQLKNFKFIFPALFLIWLLPAISDAQQVDSVRVTLSPEEGTHKMELRAGADIYVSPASGIESIRVRLGEFGSGDIIKDITFAIAALTLQQQSGTGAYYYHIDIGHLELGPPDIECTLQLTGGGSSPVYQKQLID